MPSKETEFSASLLQMIDVAADLVRRLPAAPPHRLHNGPPEGLTDTVSDEEAVELLPVQERDRTLRAYADMRFAVVSADYSRAGQVWEAIQPFVQRLGSAASRHLDQFFAEAAIHTPKIASAAVPGYLLHAVGVLDTNLSIGISLAVLTALQGRARPGDD